MERCWASGSVSVRFVPLPRAITVERYLIECCWKFEQFTNVFSTGTLDREGNARKVVNCSCVVVKDWGEESQERSVLLNYFQTEQ